MARIPTYLKLLAFEIKDDTIILGENLSNPAVTLTISYKELKKALGKDGLTGVTAIIDKLGNLHTGNVQIITSDIFESQDFKFVTDADLETLKRFFIEDITEILEIHDQNGVKILAISDTSVNVFKKLFLEDIVDGDRTMESLVIDPLTNEVKKFKLESGESFVYVNQVNLGLEVVLNDVIALVDDNYILANATDELKVAIGIVVDIIDDDNIKYQESGTYEYIGGGLAKGSTYYLDINDGKATLAEPANYKQSIFTAIETDEILINIHPLFVLEDSSSGVVEISISVSQVGLGILASVDSVIALVGNSYILANATDSSKVGIGVVTKVLDDNNIQYKGVGSFSTSNAYIKGNAYYLNTIDGGVTSIEPENYKQHIFTAIETDSVLLNITPMYVTQDGLGGSAEIVIAVGQVGIGLLTSLDDAIAINGSSYVLANATDNTKVAVGIVTKIIDDDNIEYKDTGTYDTAGTYSQGNTYYLNTIDGESTNTEPTNYKQSLFVAIEANKVLLNISPMYVIGDGNTIKEENISGTRLTNLTVSGNQNLDWDLYKVFEFILIGNATLIDLNIPTGVDTKVINMMVSGDFTLTFPAYYEALPSNDPYDGTKRNQIIINLINGSTGIEDINYSLETLAT